MVITININKNYDINDIKVKLSIENLAQKITKKIEEYKINKDKNVQIELEELLNDRKKIYELDQDTINKYM